MATRRHFPKALAAPGTHDVIVRLVIQEAAFKRVVLDIPCGPGALAAKLQELGMEVHGVDVVNYLEAKNVTFAQADMNEPLLFTDERFDVVVCADGIEHISRQFDFVRECHRILRPGGHLVLSTPNISSLRSRWRWLLTGFHNKGKTPLNETRPLPRHHIGLLAFHELRYLLHVCGFRITAIATNRIKPIALLYLPVVPFSFVAAHLTFLMEEKDSSQRTRNREILGQMFTPAVLFGESTIVKAVCEK